MVIYNRLFKQEETNHYVISGEDKAVILSLNIEGNNLAFRAGEFCKKMYFNIDTKNLTTISRRGEEVNEEEIAEFIAGYNSIKEDNLVEERKVTYLTFAGFWESANSPMILRGDAGDLLEEEKESLEKLKNGLEKRGIPYVIDTNSTYIRKRKQKPQY